MSVAADPTVRVLLQIIAAGLLVVLILSLVLVVRTLS